MRTTVVRAVWRILTVVAIAAAMVVTTQAVASAASGTSSAPYPPVAGCTVSVSSNVVTAGQPVDIVGSGFPASTAVKLSIDGQGLGTVNTDSSGSFTATVAVPQSIGSGAHRITASSASETCSFDAVSQVEPTATHTSPPNAPLANTGFATLTAGTIAFLLLAGGSLLLLVGRRRRHS